MRAQEEARWRPSLRDVVRCSDELSSVANAYHGAEVADFVTKRFGVDVHALLGRLAFSRILEEEAEHIQPAEECTYLPARFHLGSVGFHTAIDQNSRMEDGEVYPYVFVIDDSSRSKFQACFRIDEGGAAFSILASSSERFPYCLTPGGTEEDIASARTVASDAESADPSKWLASLLTSRHKAAAHLAVDLFDWWYHSRGGRADYRLSSLSNWDLITSVDFIQVRRALMSCSTVREVRRVFKTLDGDIERVLASARSQGQIPGLLPDGRLSKRPKFGKRGAVETWRAVLEVVRVDAVEDLDAALDFCVKYAEEYESNTRFSSAADRLLSSAGGAEDMNSNLLRECLRV